MTDQHGETNDGNSSGGGGGGIQRVGWMTNITDLPLFIGMGAGGGGGGSYVGPRRMNTPWDRGSPTVTTAQLINMLAGRTILNARFEGDGTGHMDGHIVVTFTDGSEIRLYGEHDEGIAGEWTR